jgi:hypothetical protein
MASEKWIKEEGWWCEEFRSDQAVLDPRSNAKGFMGIAGLMD